MLSDSNSESPVRRLAVFGDLHGHVRLMYQLCRLWQMNHGVKLDGILQCGDLGFYPDPKAIDKATQRYASRDPEELGFGYVARESMALRSETKISKRSYGLTRVRLRCPALWSGVTAITRTFRSCGTRWMERSSTG